MSQEDACTQVHTCSLATAGARGRYSQVVHAVSALLRLMTQQSSFMLLGRRQANMQRGSQDRHAALDCSAASLIAASALGGAAIDAAVAAAGASAVSAAEAAAMPC